MTKTMYVLASASHHSAPSSPLSATCAERGPWLASLDGWWPRAPAGHSRANRRAATLRVWMRERLVSVNVELLCAGVSTVHGAVWSRRCRLLPLRLSVPGMGCLRTESAVFPCAGLHRTLTVIIRKRSADFAGTASETTRAACARLADNHIRRSRQSTPL